MQLRNYMTPSLHVYTRLVTNQTFSLAKPRLHTRREGLDNCLCASCAALHEIVQSNQIADRGNVTYAHIPPPTLCQSAIIHVWTQREAGPRCCRLVAAGVILYIKDAATSLGITTLRTEQQEAIRQFILGRDVFVSLPTGYGKSVCYFFPSRSCLTV